VVCGAEVYTQQEIPLAVTFSRRSFARLIGAVAGASSLPGFASRLMPLRLSMAQLERDLPEGLSVGFGDGLLPG